MSENDNSDDSSINPEEFQAFLRDFFEKGQGGMDAAKLAEAAGLPQDPKAIAEMLAQLQKVFGSQTSTGVNWSLASDQARTIAAKESREISDDVRRQISSAVSVASLWLNQATSVSELSSDAKILTRELWVQDAMPLFQALSNPVAERMSTALTDNLRDNAPEELSAILGNAGGIMKSAGGALFAMQLGQALGRLSSEVITGSDIGLPIFQEQRAAFVAQNLEHFVNELDVESDQVYIYLAVRELAHARLFKHSKWLREQIVSQITNYAAEIRIDNERVHELAEDFDPNNADKLREALESGAFIAARSEDQQLALDRIETMLALIEGWVDAVTESATNLLPRSQAIAEAIRRRRATGGPAEKTFATLVGLELRPRKLREAAAMWRAIGEAVGQDNRDALWSHPDLLPTAADIENPAMLIAKLSGKPSSGDDELDNELRKLLGE